MNAKTALNSAYNEVKAGITSIYQTEKEFKIDLDGIYIDALWCHGTYSSKGSWIVGRILISDRNGNCVMGDDFEAKTPRGAMRAIDNIFKSAYRFGIMEKAGIASAEETAMARKG